MIKRILAVCLALLLLCGAALAETIAADTVLLTVGDREFNARDIDTRAYLLYSEGRVEEYPDYDTAVDSLIQDAVLEDYLKNNGYTDFDEEEEASFRNEAQATWDGYLDNYVKYYLTEDTEEAKAELRVQAEQFFISQGATLDGVIEDLRIQAALEKLEVDLVDGYVPSEEEITAIFDQLAPLYQEEFENNVQGYEFYTMQYGESLYVPEGYRSVLHILLDAEKDLLQAYIDARMELEELESDETVDEAAVASTRDKVETARTAIIASRQEDIDNIYSRLDAGESFQDLIAEYGKDPGMQKEEYLKEGYKVHQDSIMYDPAFVAGAFEDGMQKPGDVSRPVVSTSNDVNRSGIHIIYYLADVPGGLIMTDSIHDEIAQVLANEQLNKAYNETLTTWKDTMEISLDEDLLAELKAEAEEQMAEAEQAQ